MLDRLLEQSESTNKEERTNEYEYFYKRNKNKMYFTIHNTPNTKGIIPIINYTEE